MVCAAKVARLGAVPFFNCKEVLRCKEVSRDREGFEIGNGLRIHKVTAQHADHGVVTEQSNDNGKDFEAM